MEAFDNRPFKDLASIWSRDRQNESGQQAGAEEKELFLRSWQSMSKKAKAYRNGFLLEDQVKLPRIVVKARKKKPSVCIEKTEPAKPSADDEIFLQAVRSARPLEGKGRKVSIRPVMNNRVIEKEISLEDYMVSNLEFALSSRDEYLEGFVVGLDELIVNRLREGQFSPEANLDMHGLNSDQAFEALKEFIRQAWYKDLRTVLVVPGRGLNSPNGLGILRQKIQIWLTREPFKRLVLAFCTAKPHDGGPGSIYILLRRNRKKGPVQWERLFVEGEID